MRGLIGYIWSICSNGSLIKEKFSVVWWSISMEFVEFIQGSLISKFFSCTYLAESLTVRFELFYCTHNLNTPVGRCDVPIERQPLIRGASWKVLHDRSSSNVNVWWTGKTENRISSAEGEVRSSGERESRFIHEFSVRWRRKITPNSWLRVSLTKGVRKEKKKHPFRFSTAFSVERAHPPLLLLLLLLLQGNIYQGFCFQEIYFHSRIRYRGKISILSFSFFFSPFMSSSFSETETDLVNRSDDHPIETHLGIFNAQIARNE